MPAILAVVFLCWKDPFFDSLSFSSSRNCIHGNFAMLSACFAFGYFYSLLSIGCSDYFVSDEIMLQNPMAQQTATCHYADRINCLQFGAIRRNLRLWRMAYQA